MYGVVLGSPFCCIPEVVSISHSPVVNRPWLAVSTNRNQHCRHKLHLRVPDVHNLTAKQGELEKKHKECLIELSFLLPNCVGHSKCLVLCMLAIVSCQEAACIVRVVRGQVVLRLLYFWHVRQALVLDCMLSSLILVV